MENKKVTKWPAKADFPFARPGLVYICSACIVTGLLFFMGWWVPGVAALAATAFVCWFFRDPDRLIPGEENALVSPADGRVVKAEKVMDNDYVDGPCIMVSIFMNVFNVHVNRVPFAGTVEETTYYPGKFFNASLDKASKDNERNALVLRTNQGSRYGVVQIAGLVARRIVCDVKQGDILVRGDRYGMICFGSRLDLYLPMDTRICVKVGERVSAGSSIVGYMA
ncbi:Psd [Desulforapulum autotrophicum HRM2]|uniref:Phosphatidylserine decarboxylase proenzyme n=1 Tax=Desulforapulum autotrophicum (strain ATCC 43914 / DSM 3382 / VKM B-1955 / HRM2) TaxID=177437 RepID=C0QKN1_DESAH|nr:phosphatidylserine decarboxylase family protein [Desulforapulum autotrophicum]ACN16121.1 Psd [Desulforapulum autotrophicum HRM2]